MSEHKHNKSPEGNHNVKTKNPPKANQVHLPAFQIRRPVFS